MGHRENLVRERLEREEVEEERRFQEREQARAEEERERKRLIKAIAAEMDRISELLTDEDWATHGKIREFSVKVPDADRVFFKKFAWFKSSAKYPTTTERVEFALFDIFTGSSDGYVRSDGEHYAQDEYCFGIMAEVVKDRNISYLTALATALTQVSTASELPVHVKNS